MGERRSSSFRMLDVFTVALLFTIQFPALLSIIIFLLYVWMTDEVFNKVLQSHRRRR